jgi:hypothetical protein
MIPDQAAGLNQCGQPVESAANWLCDALYLAPAEKFLDECAIRHLPLT